MSRVSAGPWSFSAAWFGLRPARTKPAWPNRARLGTSRHPRARAAHRMGSRTPAWRIGPRTGAAQRPGLAAARFTSPQPSASGRVGSWLDPCRAGRPAGIGASGAPRNVSQDGNLWRWPRTRAFCHRTMWCAWGQGTYGAIASSSFAVTSRVSSVTRSSTKSITLSWSNCRWRPSPAVGLRRKNSSTCSSWPA